MVEVVAPREHTLRPHLVVDDAGFIFLLQFVIRFAEFLKTGFK